MFPKSFDDPMIDPEAVHGDGEGCSTSLSPYGNITYQAAMALHDSDNEEYQDTNKLFTNLLEEHHITMEQTRATNIYGYPTSNDELYCLNDEVNLYTGMNKEESRKAASAREKNIQIVAYLLAKVILIILDFLVVCSGSAALTDRRDNHLDILVGPKGPTRRQYIDINLVQRVTLCDIWTLQKEEDIHSLFVYWYFLIMNFINDSICWYDKKKYDNMVLVFGHCVTPLLRDIIDIIYEDRKDKTETFETFIKRIMSFGRKLCSDEKIKVSQQSSVNFDICLMNKIMEAFMNYCINEKVPQSVVDVYKELHLKCKEITKLRNGKFHNLPELDKAICNDYDVNFNKIIVVVDHLERFIKKQCSTLHISRKYMKLTCLSSFPLSTNDVVAISLYIFLPIYIPYYVFISHH